MAQALGWVVLVVLVALIIAYWCGVLVLATKAVRVVRDGLRALAARLDR